MAIDTEFSMRDDILPKVTDGGRLDGGTDGRTPIIAHVVRECRRNAGNASLYVYTVYAELMYRSISQCWTRFWDFSSVHR